MQATSSLATARMDEIDDPMTSIENADYNPNKKKGQSK